jgi:hypothetical protein
MEQECRAEIRRQKKNLIDQIDKVDLLAEQNLMTAQDKEDRLRWKKELEKIFQLEETRAWQRSRERYVREGDRNTSYFFALAN